MNEMELTDGTNVFAEAGALEEAVDRESGGEVAQDEPSGRSRAVPEAESLIGPEVSE